ncbi:hypothetical protein ALNOE001_11800 [Candidatus Methanobinarius endosymbioticus]|uniref:Right handed beta helix domain-containing protein n=1 Tax=Candidatus Methanobinarius endosymbioticus TaxID=2006182 RepID=A0A366MAK7_9EURY|nr:hypothetical protein ALNOE001_11800 [Candidatus Methanobinarius endosymbioticus]
MINNTLFSNNNASFGGTIWNSAGSHNVTIINSIFDNNHASTRGGAIYNTGWNITIEKNSFTNHDNFAVETYQPLNSLKNNSFTDNFGVLGIYFDDTNINLNIDVLNNTVNNNQYIFAIKGNRNNVSNGFINRSNFNGILINGVNNTLKNITIGNLTDTGLIINSTVVGNNLTNITIANNSNGIIIQGSNNIFNSSTVMNNDGYGLNLTGNNNNINYNRIVENSVGLYNSGNSNNINLNWWGVNNCNNPSY